ncbi:Putative zinc-finger [Amycolatopsis xylanica]|uniref:Putative zinc-finger n=1 Tax=Amycolatopsis xylanica TaxID=589385 RepID=A0A1H3N3J4_9PSEU|nr:zf-HC2 domain-containing protein [Amycolatopsis xylanica]SDY83406.1 Putative zinc-finger [Amycolatopsis xylanica]
MNTHDTDSLGVYVLGKLDPDEAKAVEAHLAACAACRQEVEELREIQVMLGAVPDEAFLDGPPEDELVMPRLVRRVRDGPRFFTPGRLVAASIVVAAIGGLLLGRGTAPTEQVASPVPAPTTQLNVPPAAGTKVASVTDQASGARMTLRVEPAAGWVRVNLAAAGIKAGEKCRIVVVSRSGERVVAGSWLVSPDAERVGSNVDGTALIPLDQVASVEIATFAGRTMVAAQL